MTRIFAVLASLFLFSTGLFGGALPASAHADLVSTDPVDGSVLERAPDSITLSFNSKVLDSMAELAVSNSAGELIPGIVAETVKTTATAVWPMDLPGDTYEIAYRIVSEDGHPITGSFSFSYPDSVTDPQVTTMETLSPENSAVEPTSTSSGSMLGWVIGFLALVLIVVGYFIWRKRST